jgi:hypothetical protein
VKQITFPGGALILAEEAAVLSDKAEKALAELREVDTELKQAADTSERRAIVAEWHLEEGIHRLDERLRRIERRSWVDMKPSDVDEVAAAARKAGFSEEDVDKLLKAVKSREAAEGQHVGRDEDTTMEDVLPPPGAEPADIEGRSEVFKMLDRVQSHIDKSAQHEEEVGNVAKRLRWMTRNR